MYVYGGLKTVYVCLCLEGLLLLNMIHDNACFLFGLRLYVPVNNFSVMSGRFPRLNQY